MSPVEALERIAYLLERAREPTYRVGAFRTAAARVRALDPEDLAERAARGRLREIPGVGETIALVITETIATGTPSYLAGMEEKARSIFDDRGEAIRRTLRGDLHSHSDWSDGGSSIEEMARAAHALGHEYLALTDHSPRLQVAKGLSPDRLRQQLEVVAELNQRLDSFRVLAGIEVDILEDGALDQEESLLGQLDVVVASVHSKLRMDPDGMTRRLITAVSNPLVDVLGHCTGRLVIGRGRPESTFDSKEVFGACARNDVAVEINCRPERLDPPRRLLRAAAEMGCKFAIDTDAHAPGQLEWQHYGCSRAAECGVPVDSIINSWSRDTLVAWAQAKTDRAVGRRVGR